MKRLLIGEKPSLVRDVFKHIPEDLKHIKESIDVMYAIPYGVLPFDIPRDLPLSGVPFTKTPTFKINPVSIKFIRKDGIDYPDKLDIFGPQYNDESRNLRDQVQVLKKLFSSYDEIYFAMDPDHSGQFTAYYLLHLAGLNVESPKVSHLRLMSLTNADTHRSWHQAVIYGGLDDVLSRMMAYGRIKRYFDYQWAINSAPISSILLRDADLTPGILSKYHIQTLMLMESGETMSLSSLIDAMQSYKGTGKYPDNRIGSCASRVTIVEQLAELGAISWIDDNNTRISEKGSRLLSLMHKKFKDRDLPGRLQQWLSDVYDGKLSEDEAKMVIDRYIRTLFGKQKNFMKG